jgi:hypothetical protein
MGVEFQLVEIKYFWRNPRAFTGSIVKNIDMTSPVLTQRETGKKFSQLVHYKLDQYGNFQSPGIIESIAHVCS